MKRLDETLDQRARRPRGRPDAAPAAAADGSTAAGEHRFADAPGRVAAGLDRILMQIMVLRDRTRQIGLMAPDDRFYFLGRAEEELELAQSAAHESAGRAHALLAGYYFDRAYRGMDEPSDPPPLAA